MCFVLFISTVFFFKLMAFSIIFIRKLVTHNNPQGKGVEDFT